MHLTTNKIKVLFIENVVMLGDPEATQNYIFESILAGVTADVFIMRSPYPYTLIRHRVASSANTFPVRNVLGFGSILRVAHRPSYLLSPRSLSLLSIDDGRSTRTRISTSCS